MNNQAKYPRGLLDTSVVIDHERVKPQDLPVDFTISTLTLAELAAGPHAATTAAVRGERQERLQRIEASLNPIAFGPNAARAYGRIYAAALGTGRQPRGAQAVDLMIAATALAEGLPLFTRNPKDFAALEGLVEIVAV